MNQLKDMSNLELESFKLSINNDRESQSFVTKVEHKRILGVFITVNGINDIKDSMIEIAIDNRNIVGYNSFLAKIIQANDTLSYKDVYWQLNKEINSSSVNIIYQNNADSTGYDIYVHFICQR